MCSCSLCREIDRKREETAATDSAVAPVALFYVLTMGLLWWLWLT